MYSVVIGIFRKARKATVQFPFALQGRNRNPVTPYLFIFEVSIDVYSKVLLYDGSNVARLRNDLSDLHQRTLASCPE